MDLSQLEHAVSRPIRLLVVDDSTTVRLSLRDVLVEAGYAVEAVDGGTAALDMLSREHFDVVLLDLVMEDMSGADVLAALKADAALAWIPVILLTAVADRAELVRCLDRGADDFIVKPWDENELKGRIRVMARLKEALDEAHRKKREMRALLDAPVQSSILVDQHGQVLAANQVASDLLMTSLPELERDCLFAIAGRQGRALWSQHLREVLTSGSASEFEEETCSRIYQTRIHPMMDEAGSVSGATIATWDITDQRELQVQLAHTHKLESIGQLAAGIAHEINTPTQYVKDNVCFLQDATQDIVGLLNAYKRVASSDELRERASEVGTTLGDLLQSVDDVTEDIDLDYLLETLPSALDQTLEGIERISKIVRSMKEFSHPGSTTKTDVDLNQTIESTLTVSANEWKYDADVVTDFDPELKLVPMLQGEFNQVLLNIIVNATHAIRDAAEERGNADDKGTITIRTRREDDAAVIEISDTGTGIPDQIKNRIFDPFFTTKGVGKGTGQGLAIAYSVVTDKHGGQITVASSPGAGATFAIRLPLNVSP